MKEELTMRGEYNPSEWYHRMDVVTNGKRAFLVLLSNKGHDLNDTKYFMAVASAEGINGKDGLSAYDLAVKFEGFQGSVTDWLDSLKGGGSGDGSGVSLKIDKSQIATIKKPSDYSEGFSYELKNVDAIGLDRSNYDKSVQDGAQGLLTTVVIKDFVRQRLEIIDSSRPLTFERNGTKDTWNVWEFVTNLVAVKDTADDNPVKPDAGGKTDKPSDSGKTDNTGTKSDNQPKSDAPKSDAPATSDDSKPSSEVSA